MRIRLFLVLIVSILTILHADTLDIYWVDVEGGAATLIVTPTGKTILTDAGWPGFEGRDAKRIETILSKQANVEKIDYFIASHFHRDHVGGLPALAERVTIGKFVDHGDSVELSREDGLALWKKYLSVAQGNRLEAVPGNVLSLDGIELMFVASHSRFLAMPLEGDSEKNPHCLDASRSDSIDTGENGKSVGFIVRFGDFEFLTLGDLTWNFEHELACPVNRLGEVDLYQVTHHGLHTGNGGSSVAPQQVWASRPTVAVMNNGPRKGGSPEAYTVLAQSPDIEDIWQVHRSLMADKFHNTHNRMIANLGETEGCEGHWIKVSVNKGGFYTLTNSRNGFSKTYWTR